MAYQDYQEPRWAFCACTAVANRVCAASAATVNLTAWCFARLACTQNSIRLLWTVILHAGLTRAGKSCNNVLCAASICAVSVCICCIHSVHAVLWKPCLPSAEADDISQCNAIMTLSLAKLHVHRVSLALSVGVACCAGAIDC